MKRNAKTATFSTITAVRSRADPPLTLQIPTRFSLVLPGSFSRPRQSVFRNTQKKLERFNSPGWLPQRERREAREKFPKSYILMRWEGTGYSWLPGFGSPRTKLEPSPRCSEEPGSSWSHTHTHTHTSAGNQLNTPRRLRCDS